MADEEGTGYLVHYEGRNEATDWIEEPGKCKVTYPNGNVFEGTYDDEKKKQGEGSYTWSIKKEEDEEEEEAKPALVAIYSGSFKTGKKHGSGTLTYPDGARYEGQFYKDRKQGQGRYFYTNGDMYEGEWSADEKEGEGTYTHTADGSKFIGTWVKGEFVQGKWQYADGGCYEGAFAAGVPTGGGKYTMAGGSTVAGAYNPVVIPEGEEPEEGAPTVKWQAGQVTMVA